MGLAVGIDLGTTNSVVARLDDQGRPVVVPNGKGRATTPSVVCFHDGEILVGEEAKDWQAVGEWPLAAFFKRQMGDRTFEFHAEGTDYTAIELSSLVLRKLKADAETATGESIDHAVITVPAYFRDVERRATIEAGQEAGLEVLQVINEPTAAAIAYGAARRAGSREHFLVYDLGGGTFDITLLELAQDGISVRWSDGDHHLGGKDWDDRLIEFLGSRFHDEFGVDPLADAVSLSELLVHVETAKQQLSAVLQTTVSIVHGRNRGRYTLTRETFEELTRDLLERTIALSQQVLKDARVRPENIGGVLFVGGSTRMPAVHRRMEEAFGKQPLAGVNVDEAVALGAAIVAAERFAERNAGSRTFLLPGAVKMNDVTNHSLGMIAINAEASAYVNSIILPKSAKIPCEETRVYKQRTTPEGANCGEIFMTQGEATDPDKVAYVGKYVIHDVPHESGVTVVDVTYCYDRSGTVEVSASKSGRPLTVTIEELGDDVPRRFLQSPNAEAEAQGHLTAYLAFDMSGSMDGEPLEEAKRAAHGFLEQTDLGHSSLGVIACSDDTLTKLKASQDARAISRAIMDLECGETGYGNSGDPFEVILKHLKDMKGRRFAIVLADGVWYEREIAIKRARKCHRAGIEIIAIGFGEADEKFLRKIASSDKASFYVPMNKLVNTFSTIARVLQETDGGSGPGGDAGGSGRGLGHLQRF